MIPVLRYLKNCPMEKGLNSSLLFECRTRIKKEVTGRKCMVLIFKKYFYFHLHRVLVTACRSFAVAFTGFSLVAALESGLSDSGMWA